MEVLLYRGYEYHHEKVAYMKQSADDELIGHCKANTFLDTRVYKDMFYGRQGVQLYANRVAEYTLTLCDADNN